MPRTYDPELVEKVVTIVHTAADAEVAGCDDFGASPRSADIHLGFSLDQIAGRARVWLG